MRVALPAIFNSSKTYRGTQKVENSGAFKTKAQKTFAACN